MYCTFDFYVQRRLYSHYVSRHQKVQFLYFKLQKTPSHYDILSLSIQPIPNGLPHLSVDISLPEVCERLPYQTFFRRLKETHCNVIYKYRNHKHMTTSTWPQAHECSLTHYPLTATLSSHANDNILTRLSPRELRLDDRWIRKHFSFGYRSKCIPPFRDTCCFSF